MSLGPSQDKLMFNLHTGFNHGSSWVRFRLGWPYMVMNMVPNRPTHLLVGLHISNQARNSWVLLGLSWQDELHEWTQWESNPFINLVVNVNMNTELLGWFWIGLAACLRELPAYIISIVWLPLNNRPQLYSTIQSYMCHHIKSLMQNFL